MTINLTYSQFAKVLEGKFSIGVYHEAQAISLGFEKITQKPDRKFMMKHKELTFALHALQKAKLNYDFCPKSLRHQNPNYLQNSVFLELKQSTEAALESIKDISIEKTMDRDLFELQQLSLKIQSCIESLGDIFKEDEATI
jgi:hypothetical protein